MERWRGRVALVTGASAGIGRAVAEDLLAAGMRVAIAARRAERLAEVAAAAPERTLACPADLRDPSAVEALFARVRQAWGGVDVLVNNAGFGRRAPLLEGDLAAWRGMLELNVLALCQCTAEAVRDMRARGDQGHVIHVGSMSGHRTPPGTGVYGATKFAVRSLTESLRQELREAGSQIRVSAVSPGFVETEFAGVYHGDPQRGRETYARFKVLEPRDVAAAVRFLLAAPPHVQVHDVLVRPTDQPT